MARARVGTVLGTMEVIQTCKHDEDGDDVDAGGGDSGLNCFLSTVNNHNWITTVLFQGNYHALMKTRYLIDQQCSKNWN